MKRNSFRLIFFINIVLVFFLFFVSSSLAAVLRWSPVESTESCVINGYKVHYGTIYGLYTHVVDVVDSFCDLELLYLDPTLTYSFAISAVSTMDQEGPLSAPVFCTNSPPNIVGSPSIDHANGTIDATFNENNMQGADIKGNYEFIPKILFDEAHDIVRTDRTYRLFLNYIPEYVFITMTVIHVTDKNGLALVSDSIGLNDDDKDGMGDGREVQFGLNPPLDDTAGDLDGDGISNWVEYNEGTDILNKSFEKPFIHCFVYQSIVMPGQQERPL